MYFSNDWYSSKGFVLDGDTICLPPDATVEVYDPGSLYRENFSAPGTVFQAYHALLDLARPGTTNSDILSFCFEHGLLHARLPRHDPPPGTPEFAARCRDSAAATDPAPSLLSVLVTLCGLERRNGRRLKRCVHCGRSFSTPQTATADCGKNCLSGCRVHATRGIP